LNFKVTGTSEFRTASVSLTVLISDFAFTSAPDAVTVRAGESVTYALAIRPVNGLSGTVTLGCSGAPRGASCAVAPGSVALNGSNLAHARVTVTTTARSMGAPGTGWPVLPPGIRGWVGLPWLLWIVALTMLAGLLVGRRRRAWVGIAAALLWVVVWTACGGGGGFVGSGASGTPPGTYLLKVTGTYTAAPSEVSGALTHDTTLGLKVN
jgi:hypothetical protein